jgi:hypothetical protein
VAPVGARHSCEEGDEARARGLPLLSPKQSIRTLQRRVLSRVRPVELVNCAAIQASASERQIHRQVTRSARPTLERVAKRPRRRATGTTRGRSPRSSFTRSRRLVLFAVIDGDQARRDQGPESRLRSTEQSEGRAPSRARGALAQRPSKGPLGPKRQYTTIASAAEHSGCSCRWCYWGAIASVGKPVVGDRSRAGYWTPAGSTSSARVSGERLQRYWRGSNCCPGT